MPTTQRLACFGIADGALVAVLIRRLAFADGPHQVIAVATVLALLLGFLGAIPAALRSLRAPHQPGRLRIVRRGDALLLCPDEGAEAAGKSDRLWPRAAEPAPWITIVTYGLLMVALMWRWAFLAEPHTVLDGVTVSVLMFGFLRGCAAAVQRLGPPQICAAASGNVAQDELLLFPAEDAGAKDWLRPHHPLATRRKALL